MSAFKRFLLNFTVLTGMLLGLPLIGVYLSGYPLERYLEFPPQTRYIVHAPFSWTAFAVFALLITAVVLPLFIKGFKLRKKGLPGASVSITNRFPWWGWIGIVAGIFSWILAWSRFSWFSAFQPHTFSPLWFSYILVVNALCFRRTGHSLMTDRPGYFLLLFPASAAFWWFFEYLNRFVQNWYYLGVAFSSWSYFWYATLPFSTVLPAVLSTRQHLLSVSWIREGYGDFKSLEISHPRIIAVCLMLFSAAGLAAIGVWPNHLFPLLWVSPLLIIICLQILMKQHHALSVMAAGDWRDAVSAALSAVVCGMFWEMWNYFSLAKWEYSIPLVHRFVVFEMPFLGYAGYLPFGLECLVIGHMIGQLFNENQSRLIFPLDRHRQIQ
jgi:hypothetical protein